MIVNHIDMMIEAKKNGGFYEYESVTCDMNVDFPKVEWKINGEISNLIKVRDLLNEMTDLKATKNLGYELGKEGVEFGEAKEIWMDLFDIDPDLLTEFFLSRFRDGYKEGQGS